MSRAFLLLPRLDLRRDIKRDASRLYAAAVSASGGRRRARGGIDLLPRGAYRVGVYAGLDPLTGKRNYLAEVVPSGPKAASEAEKLKTRLLSQVDEHAGIGSPPT